MENKNRVQFKYSLWKEQDKKLETILYSLAGLVGILDGTLGIIVAFNENFPYQHPIIFRTGLGSLFLVLIFGFIISCIREYRCDAKKLKKDMIKIGKIILFSFIFTAIMFALIIYNLRS
ncbi:hypothetical protein IJ843_07445 [bacterium]|nr:hypothetical protein [bacterium]